MIRRELSNNQLQEAQGIFSDAVHNYGGLSQAEVPRPSFASFTVWAAAKGIQLDVKRGGFVMKPGSVLTKFAGLMGIAVIPRQNGQPQTLPAIVLEDGQRLGVLGGQNDLRFSPLKQMLLDNVYLNHRATVLSHPSLRSPAGVGGHAVIAASALANAVHPHDIVHSFTSETFGSTVAKQGIFDVVVGQQTLAVRSAVFTLARTAFIVAEHYQPHSQDVLGAGITGEDANVACTLAATLSHPEARRGFDIGRNLAAMDGRY